MDDQGRGGGCGISIDLETYEPTEEEIRYAKRNKLPWDFNAREGRAFNTHQALFRATVPVREPSQWRMTAAEAVEKMAHVAQFTVEDIRSKRRGKNRDELARVRAAIVYAIRRGWTPVAIVPSFTELAVHMRPESEPPRHTTLVEAYWRADEQPDLRQLAECMAIAAFGESAAIKIMAVRSRTPCTPIAERL
jgi:hypothetical protein